MNLSEYTKKRALLVADKKYDHNQDDDQYQLMKAKLV